MREATIHSLGELIDAVTPSEPDPRTGKRRDSGIYRGTADAERSLLTSLDRLGGIEPPRTKTELEEHILRNFIRYSRPFFQAPPVNDWEVLVAAQHHGLPTRFLDWTYSPLVAAHFATLGVPADKRDRVIWRLDWQRVHERFELPPIAMPIQDLARMFGDEAEEFTPWALFRRRAKDKPFACMVEPPSLDSRIVMQSAVFTLCSDKTRAFDEFLEAHGLGDALTRLRIPAKEVSRLRDQLDMASVDERRLFPDLDGLAAFLQRYYS
jgi:hypothetical protein